MSHLTPTEKIEAWIAVFGNVRDALNTAITRLEAKQLENEALEQDRDKMIRRATQLEQQLLVNGILPEPPLEDL